MDVCQEQEDEHAVEAIFCDFWGQRTLDVVAAFLLDELCDEGARTGDSAVDIAISLGRCVSAFGEFQDGDDARLFAMDEHGALLFMFSESADRGQCVLWSRVDMSERDIVSDECEPTGLLSMHGLLDELNRGTHEAFCATVSRACARRYRRTGTLRGIVALDGVDAAGALESAARRQRRELDDMADSLFFNRQK